MQFALNLWGFLADAPPELTGRRRVAFSGISHDYAAQRQLADSVPDETLHLGPEEVSPEHTRAADAEGEPVPGGGTAA